MSKPLTKSDLIDVILVVFGLYCIFHGSHAFIFDIVNTVILQHRPTLIYRSPWASGLYAILLFLLAYISLFHRKTIIPVILRYQPSVGESKEIANPACLLATAFWVQMFGLYQFVKAIFNMTQYLAFALSSNMDGFTNSHKWSPHISHFVLLVMAAVIIWKSRQIGDYLDNLRGAPNNCLKSVFSESTKNLEKVD